MGSRIIGGSLRGRKLGSLPKGAFTRPILARIKKSLFDILKSRISGASFLDLFAGTGAVGLEALSRGARRVVFIDSSPQCRRWIEDTIKQLSGSSNELFMNPRQCEVYKADVLSGLAWLNEKFDIVFSGTPYKDERKAPLQDGREVLFVVARDQILSENGWLIIQHHAKERLPASAHWDFFRQEQYGDTFLSFFKPLKYVRKD